jgi:hypothetical protein
MSYVPSVIGAPDWTSGQAFIGEPLASPALTSTAAATVYAGPIYLANAPSTYLQVAMTGTNWSLQVSWQTSDAGFAVNQVGYEIYQGVGSCSIVTMVPTVAPVLYLALSPAYGSATCTANGTITVGTGNKRGAPLLSSFGLGIDTQARSLAAAGTDSWYSSILAPGPATWSFSVASGMTGTALLSGNTLTSPVGVLARIVNPTVGAVYGGTVNTGGYQPMWRVNNTGASAVTYYASLNYAPY